MDNMSILYAALGGGLGAGLGSLIGRALNTVFRVPENRKGYLVAAFAASLSVLGYTYSTSLYAKKKSTDSISKMETDILSASPIYPVLKEYEPEAYNKLVETIVEGVRNGKPLEGLINDGRKSIEGLIIEKIPYADDASLYKMAALTHMQFTDFKKNKPSLCSRLLRGQGLGDITPFVSREYLDRDQDYTIAIIKLARTNMFPIDQEQYEKTLDAMEQQMIVYIGEVPPNFTNTATLTEQGRVCDIGAKAMGDVLALPLSEGANYMRKVLQD